MNISKQPVLVTDSRARASVTKTTLVAGEGLPELRIAPQTTDKTCLQARYRLYTYNSILVFFCYKHK